MLKEPKVTDQFKMLMDRVEQLHLKLEQLLPVSVGPRKVLHHIEREHWKKTGEGDPHSNCLHKVGGCDHPAQGKQTESFTKSS